MNDLPGHALPAEQRVLEAASRSLRGESRGLRALLPFLGPAFVAAVAYVDPQLIQLTLGNRVDPVTINPDELQPTRAGAAPFALSDASGAYDGQVLTFVDDPLNAGIRGQSFRIFRYQVDTDAAGNVLDRYFLILPPLTAGQNAFSVPGGKLAIFHFTLVPVVATPSRPPRYFACGGRAAAICTPSAGALPVFCTTTV